MLSGMIEGLQLGGNKSPVRGPESRIRKHSASASGALSRRSGWQATRSKYSNTTRSKACLGMSRDMANFFKRKFEKHLRVCTTDIVKAKNIRYSSLIRRVKRAI